MQPTRIVRSEAELEAVATSSLVSAAYGLRYIYEKAASNEWVEPGSEEAVPTAAVWEFLTGSYEGLVLDEEREVWVLIDAAEPPVCRPTRSADSPDYATRMQSRTPEYLTHPSLQDARAAIEAGIGHGVSAGHTNIWARTKDTHVFHSAVYVPPGTPDALLPWKGAA
jgi:hypothetical protein